MPRNPVLASFKFILALCLSNYSFGQCENDTVSLGPDQYFCSEINTILTPEIISTDTVTSYYWYQNDILIDSSSAIEVSSADTYILNVILGNGCVINDTITLSIVTLSGGMIDGEQILCNNAEAETLTSVSLPSVSTSDFGSPVFQWQKFATTGSWEDILNANSIDYNPGVFNETTQFRRTTSIDIEGETCEAFSNTITITHLDATLTISEPECIEGGTSISLNAELNPPISGVSTNYFWSGPNGFSPTLQSPSINSFSLSNQGDYSAIAVVPGSADENGGNCSYTSSTTLTLNPSVPSLDIPSNGCPETAIEMSILNVESGFIYTWETINNDVNISSPNSPETTFEFDAGGSYSITVLSENGQCQNSSSQSIEITNLSIDLPFVSVGGEYYDTTVVNGVITFPICTGVSSPEVKIENASFYNATNPQGTTYGIQIGSSPTQSIDDEITETIYYGSNTLILTANYNTCVLTKTYDIYSGSNPYVSIGAANTTGLCMGDSVTFVIDPTESPGVFNPPGTTYSLTISDDNSYIEVFSSLTQDQYVNYTFDETSCGVINPSISFPNNAFYAQVVAENACGETFSAVSPITVSDDPIANFSITDTTLCEGQNTTLTSEGNSGQVVGSSSPYNCSTQGKFYWEISGGVEGDDYIVNSGVLGSNNTNYYGPQANFGNGSNTIDIIFNNAGYYTASQIYYNSCERDTFSRNICVIAAPVCSFSAIPSPTCSPSDIFIENSSIIPQCGGEDINVKYTWSITNPVSGNTTSDINNPNVFEPNIGLINNTNETQNFVITLNIKPLEYNNSALWSIPNCESTCTQTATVYPRVVITPPSSSIACNNEALNIPLQANVNSSFSWYASSNPNVTGESITPQMGNTINDFLINNSTITQTVTYTIIANSIIGSCPDTIEFNVSLLPEITMDPIGSIDLCEGEFQNTIGLNANIQQTSYTWTNTNTSIGLSSGGSGNIPGFTAANTTVDVISSQIDIIPSAYGCQGDVNSFYITVNPLPNVSSVPNQTHCAGEMSDEIILNADASGSTISWVSSDQTIGIGASGNSTISSFETINTGNTVVSATISAQAELNSCSGPTTSFSITINPIPTVNITGLIALCDGQNSSIINPNSPVSGTSFSWINSNEDIGLGANSGTGSIPSFTATNNSTTPISSTITYIPENNNCVGPEEQVEITINPVPNVLPLSDTTLCSGTSLNTIIFESNPIINNTTYNWSNSSIGIGLQANGEGNIPSFIATNGSSQNVTSVIEVTPIANGCAGSPEIMNITVVPGPVVTLPSDYAYCAGEITDEISFFGTPIENTYSWTNDNPNIGLALSGSGNIQPFNSLNDLSTPLQANIIVTPNSLGCPGISQSFTITINPIPEMDLVNNFEYCNGEITDNINLSVSNNVANTNFTWTASNGNIGINSPNSGGFIPSFTAINNTLAVLTSDITVTPSSNGCQGENRLFSITVTPTPSVNSLQDISFCNNETTGIIPISSPNIGATISWSNSNTNIGLVEANGTGDVPSFVTLNETLAVESAVVSATPTLNSCEGQSTDFEIFILPSAQVTNPGDITVCHNDPVLAEVLTVQPSGTSLIWNFSNPSLGLNSLSGSTQIINGFTAQNTSTSVDSGTMTMNPSFSFNDISCLGDPQSYNIYVNPIPTLNPLPPLSVFCEYDEVGIGLSSDIDDGMSYTWTNDNSLIGVNSTGVSYDSLLFNAVNDTNQPLTSNFIVTPVFSFNEVLCSGSSLPLAITINPMPDVNPLPNYTLCATETGSNQFTSINPIIGLGTSYIWTNSNTDIGLISGGTGSHFFTSENAYTEPILSTVAVTPYYTNNEVTCIGDSSMFEITVNPMPTIDSLDDQSFCSGASSNSVIPSGNVPGTIYSWTNDNLEIPLAESGNDTIPSVNIINSGSIPIIANISVTPSYTFNDHLCVGTSEEFALITNPVPELNEFNDTSICAGNQLEIITATNPNIPGVTYTWTNTNEEIGLPTTGTGPINFIATNFGVNDIQSTITVSASFNFAGSTCTGPPKSLNVIVHPSPNMAAITDQTICAGDEFNSIGFTSDVSNTSYEWTNTNTDIGLSGSGSDSIASFIGLNSSNNILTSIVQVAPTATFNGVTCQGGIQTAILTVNPVPGVVPILDTLLCHGSSFDFFPSANIISGVEYDWTNNNPSVGLAPSGTNAISFITSNITNSIETAQINIVPTFTNNNVTCGGSNESFNIEVIPDPQLNPISDLAFCNGDTSSVLEFQTNIPTSTFSWVATNSDIGLPNSAGVGALPEFVTENISNSDITQSSISVTPSYTYNALACEGSSEIFTITVLPTPIQSELGPFNYCNETTASAVNIIGSGTTYMWTNSNIDIGLTDSGSGATIPSFTTNNTSNSNEISNLTITPVYTIDTLSCLGQTSATTITILATPDVSNPGNFTYCNGENNTQIPFSSQVSGTQFNWTNDLSNIGISSSGQGPIPSSTLINNSNNAITGNFIVTPSLQSGATICQGNPENFSITVNPSPAVLFGIANQTICSGENSASVSLNSATTGADMTWSVSNLPGSISGVLNTSGGPSNPNTIPSFNLTNSSNTPQTIEFLANATTTGQASCLGGGSLYTITVNPLPNMETPDNQTVCHNEQSAAVNFTSTFANSYAWSNNNTNIGLAASGVNDILSFTCNNNMIGSVEIGDITVTPIYTFNNVSCPGTTENFQITVNPIPIVNTPETLTYCNGEITNTIVPSGTGSSYTWTNTNTQIGLNETNGNTSINPFTTNNNEQVPVSTTINWTPTFTYNDYSCNGATMAQDIVVNPTPEVEPIEDKYLCNGEESPIINFIGTGTSYEWFNDNNTIGLSSFGIGNIQNFYGINNSTDTPENASIIVESIYTNNGLSCPGSSINFNFNVLPVASLSPMSNQEICNNEESLPVSFNGTGSYYNWTNPLTEIGLGASGEGSIPTFIGQNTGATPIISQVSVIPYFTLNETSCPGTPEYISFTVNPTAGLDTPPNQIYCANSQTNAINFTGNGTSYYWTNNNPNIGLTEFGEGNIGVFTTENSGLNPEIATITVEPIFSGGNSSCPGVNTTFTITVNPTPEVDEFNSQALCSGENTTEIDFTGVPSATEFEWTNSNELIGLNQTGIGDIQSFTSQNPSDISNQFAEIIVTPSYSYASLTCYGVSKSASITVHPIPSIDPLPNITHCNGSIVQEMNFPGTANLYSWTNSNTGTGMDESGQQIISSFTATNTSVNTIQSIITVNPSYEEDENSCAGIPETFNLYVLPTPNVNPSNDQILCNGDLSDEILFSGSISGAEYSWTNSLQSIGLLSNGIGNILPFNVINNSNSQINAQIIVTPTFTENATMCSGDPDSILIRINPTPIVNDPGLQVYCTGDSTAQLMLSGTANNYNWFADETIIGNPISGENIIPTFFTTNTSENTLNTNFTIIPIYAEENVSCPGESISIPFYVNPIPFAENIPDIEYCHEELSDEFIINGFATSYNWMNNNPSIGLGFEGINIIPSFYTNNTTLIQDTAKLSIIPEYSNYNLSCKGDTTIFNIIVNPLPHIDYIEDIIICNNDSLDIYISSDINSNYTWFASDNSLVNGELISTQTNDYIGDSLSNLSDNPQFVNYSITPTSFPAGCEGPDSNFSVQIQPDILLSIPTNIEICSGLPVNAILSANVPSQFSWFVTLDNPNVSGESVTTNINPIIDDVLINNSSQNQVVIYAVFPTSIDGSCVGDAQTISVTVKPPLDLLLDDTLAICSGDAVNLNLVSNTEVSFLWYADQNINVTGESLSAVGGPFITDILENNNNEVEQINYHVVGSSTTNGCSSPIFDIIVYVNPTPIITPLNDTTFCVDDIITPVNISGNVTNTDYNWTNNNIATGLTQQTGVESIPGFIAENNTINPLVSNIHITCSYTYYNKTCIGDEIEYNIIINPNPSVYPVVDLSICNGLAISEVNISGNTPGTEYTWNNSNTAIGLPAAGNGNIPIFIGTNSTLLPIIGTVTLTPSFTDHGLTCLGQQETFEIQINPTPKLDILDTSICSGALTNLLLSADIQSSFEWNALSNLEVYGETSNPIQNTILINDELTHYSTQPQSIQYQIMPTSIPYGCNGEVEFVEVIVHPNPNIGFTTASNILCDLAPIQFINNSVGVLDFEWDFADGNSSVLNNPIHTYASNGTYNVQLTGTNPITGCSNQSLSSLIISDSPNPNFTVSDSLSCGPQDVVFTAETTNQEWQYIWDYGNGVSTEQVGTTGYQYNEEGCYDVTLTVTDQQQCISSSIQENAICIFDEAIADFSVSEIVISSLDPTVDFYNNSINASSFEWDFGDGLSSLAENPSHTFSNDAPTYMVSLTAYNELGCIDTAMLNITLWQEFTVFVPNSFTPNSDEVNQTFLPIIAGDYKTESYRLIIYDRWGEIVFETKDPATGWDGYNKFRKRVCQDGSYIWSIRLEELPSQKVKKYRGHVNLLR